MNKLACPFIRKVRVPKSQMHRNQRNSSIVMATKKIKVPKICLLGVSFGLPTIWKYWWSLTIDLMSKPMFWKVYLLNLPESTFRPSFFVFWLKYLKFGMKSSLFMCLNILMSILDFESSESTKQGKTRGFQGQKPETISPKIASFNFFGSEALKVCPFL